jgi:hypothetical protein
MRGFTALICIFGLVLAACAKPPVEEMENAASAVTRAENDPNAVTYAGATLSRAKDALNRMRSEAESKRYEAAKNFAAEAVSAAEKAIADGRAAAARAREDAASQLNQAKAALTDTGKSLENAKTVKNIVLDFDAMDRDYDNARRTTVQAELSLAENNYPDSVDKSRTARGMLSSIDGKISGAATSVSRKK